MLDCHASLHLSDVGILTSSCHFTSGNRSSIDYQYTVYGFEYFVVRNKNQVGNMAMPVDRKCAFHLFM